MTQSECKDETVVAIIGATASGKSAFAQDLALQNGGEILNCDSVQLYRGFDIGSAKVSSEDRQKVPYHLLDTLHWSEPYDAASYARDGQKILDDILARGKTPLVVGGTALYLRALMGKRFHDLPRDPELRARLRKLDPNVAYADLQTRDPRRAQELHPQDFFRVARALEIAILTEKTFQELTASATHEVLLRSWHVILCDPPLELLKERIERRTREMLAAGWIDEVQKLLQEGCTVEHKPMQSLGYRTVAEALLSKSSLNLLELERKIVLETWQFAKKQRKHFRGRVWDCHEIVGNSHTAESSVDVN